MFALDLNLLYALLFVLALIVVDVLLGVSVALKNNTFDLKKLPQFLRTQILPYFISLASLVGLAQIKDVQNLGTVAVAWAAIVAYVSKMVFVDLKQKVINLFGTLPEQAAPAVIQAQTEGMKLGDSIQPEAAVTTDTGQPAQIPTQTGKYF